ncbi:MAG: C10 family peptidase, partial [Melioribacteraceae bacterium]|nr:C10 family peptidase [Melioribacteraceae bacterium]
GKYLSADFGKTFYDWENTLDLYSNQSFNLDNQKSAGLLVYHCAVALEMDFEYNGSTANTSDVPGILHDYFRGSGHYESVSSTGFWDEMKNNMLDQRPAIISIKSTSHSIGHAAVVDGYFATNNYYHVNPGWYGDNTGWYDISGDWNMGSYDIVVGATKGIVPSPQISEIERISESSFIISWRQSRNQNADYYELQQASSSIGPWVTLSDKIVDTLFRIDDAELGSYYYKVRAKRDSIWWDYSVVKKIQLGTERSVTFNVDMTYRPLGVGDTLIIRGNTPPLAGNINSAPMVKRDSTNIYNLALDFNYDYVGQTIIYRYFINSVNGLIAESKNREHLLTDESTQIIDAVYFDDVVSVEDEKNNNPNNFILEQNYPNPFNPSTVINYSIDGTTSVKVSLKIYDVLGKVVATLVDEEKQSGNYSVKFNTDKLSAGIYFYQLRAGQFLETKKMTLIK